MKNIYDKAPNTACTNPSQTGWACAFDFENNAGTYPGSDLNMVQTTLFTTANGDRIPLYNASSPHHTVNNISQFNSWYLDDPTFNIPITVNFTVSNAGTCDSLTYSYSNTNFLPIDHIGFGDSYSYSFNELPTLKPHNFAFTFTASLRFTYQGYERFDFTGDDDVWIFINDQLAIVNTLFTAISNF